MQLHHSIDQIHGAGAELYVIGNGAPMFMEGFRETTGYQGKLYTDPSLEVYKAAELERGFWKVVNFGAAAATLGSARRGFKQGKTQGDKTQQGGVVVVAPGGNVVYHHISKHPGDNASPDAIVAALK